MDDEGSIDGLPTGPEDQSCAFCRFDDVAWVHPLDPALVSYRVYGKGHTLPTFWCLCDDCEQVYATGDDEAALARMRRSPEWGNVPVDQEDELVEKPLAVFRRADLGPRPLTR